jgi:hypothetical protein
VTRHPSREQATGRRSQRGYRERAVETRGLRPRFLIVCEGTRTEPAYFASFRLNKRVVSVDVRGLGRRALSVVEAARRLRSEEDYRDPPDQVWCVFDRDDVSAGDFNAAVELAAREGIHVAYSNQAFELWYLLHFHYMDAAVGRQDYCGKLNELLGHPYRKNDVNIYRELESRQPSAVVNAQRLLAQYNPANPADDDPSTTVHLLVAQLNRYLV